jgi:ABC-type Fe3+-siderophore transport system permease subunit
MSGAMLQGMLRNSLADASILGISSGAVLLDGKVIHQQPAKQVA